MKVLIGAYACDPGKGSEPGVGWNWTKQAAAYHQVWALTRADNRNVIEAELSKNPIANLQFIYHDLRGAALFWKFGLLGRCLYAFCWQLTAVALCREWHRKIGFDVAHHVTFVSFHYPSCLSWLGIPFIWGPVGGCLRAPISFYPSFGFRGAFAEFLRDIAHFISPRNPVIYWTMFKAKWIVPTTEDAKRVLPKWAQSKCLVLRGDGININTDPVVRDVPTHKQGLRILWVGRLVHWKGVHLAIQAFADYLKSDPDARLTVHMDGPERPRLERMAETLGLASHIDFDITGTYAEVNQMYDRHDILIFPSLHDSGGLVVLEAMSRGLPVICLNRGGPANSVTPDVGIKVPSKNPNQVVHDLAEALRRLAADPELRHRMGENGQRRVNEVFDWNIKSGLISELYQAALSEQRPQFDGVHSQS